METTTWAPGAQPWPLMTVPCPGTSVMRLSRSVFAAVAGELAGGPEPREATVGACQGTGKGAALPTQPEDQSGGGARHDRLTPHRHNPDCLPQGDVATNT